MLLPSPYFFFFFNNIILCLASICEQFIGFLAYEGIKASKVQSLLFTTAIFQPEGHEQNETVDPGERKTSTASAEITYAQV